MRKLEEFENFVSWEVVKPGRVTYVPDPEATSCWRVGSVQWVPWRRTCSGEGTLLLLHSHPAPRIPRKDIASYPLVLPRLDLVTHLNIYLRTTQKLIECPLQKLPPGLTRDSPRPVLLLWAQSQLWVTPILEYPFPTPLTLQQEGVP